MCHVLQTGRATGRRDSIVIVAEGACDRYGNHIDSDYVKKVLEERLGEDTRVTILGHVQRGGSPSAYDRNMSTLCGHAAVEEILQADAGREPSLIGVKDNRVTRTPLMYCVEQTRAIARAIAERNFEKAMELRGKSFQTSFATLRTLVRAMPHEPPPDQRRLRIAVMNAGGLAPGMNTASRVAIRMGIDRGHTMLGVRNSFQGLIEGDIEEMGWMSVSGWSASAGSELGTNRKIPSGSDFYAIARTLERFNISALLIIGGSSGYQAAYRLYQERGNFPAFSIPLLCLPATINNNLPSAELSIGADTALNNIVEVVDKIKQAAVASHRCFVVEVMGRYCGYLAVMSGLATGAERVYTHEEGVGLRDLQADLDRLVDGFQQGRRLGLLIRNEMTHHLYSIGFMCALFEEEGKDLFEVRQAILGHLQQGGTPSPFDRIQATRLATKGIHFLIDEAINRRVAPSAGFMGRKDGQVQVFPMEDFPRMFNFEFDRPKEQWWMEIRDIARIMSKVAPH
jgi:6-phosphofructokinase 1